MAGAMGPPGAGTPNVTGRFIRHFNSIYVEPYSNASLNTIFNSVMDWNFMQHDKPAYGTPVRQLKEKIVLATIS
jgi:dynein heavy chain